MSLGFIYSVVIVFLFVVLKYVFSLLLCEYRRVTRVPSVASRAEIVERHDKQLLELDARSVEFAQSFGVDESDSPNVEKQGGNVGRAA